MQINHKRPRETQSRKTHNVGGCGGRTRTSIKAKIISLGSSKSIKTLNRRLHWGKEGIVYQHDPRLGVHNIDRFVVRLQMFASLEFAWVLVGESTSVK